MINAIQVMIYDAYSLLTVQALLGIPFFPFFGFLSDFVKFQKKKKVVDDWQFFKNKIAIKYIQCDVVLYAPRQYPDYTPLAY